MPQTIDKQAVADSFSKAACHYDKFAQLQRDIGEVLLSQLSKPKLSLNNLVDLGCGTGYFSKKLNIKFPSASLTCFDLSTVMLEQAKKHNLAQVTFQQGDIDSLPFAKESIDLIYSNLVVQWSDNLGACLKQLHSSLKTGGRCYLSTLISGTLNELTQAWKSVDDKPHTNTFLTLKDLESVVRNCAFSTINITTETRVLEYKNVVEVMRALKGIGANHVHGHQTLHISGRQLIKQLQAGYQPFINQQGLCNLTYQVCYIDVIK
jgi:malonyl-CoA O-methyltransferase